MCVFFQVVDFWIWSSPKRRLVVECSGVAEPESIAAELEERGRNGDPLMKRLFLVLWLADLLVELQGL